MFASPYREVIYFSREDLLFRNIGLEKETAKHFLFQGAVLGLPPLAHPFGRIMGADGMGGGAFPLP